jgi:hypothetical protein
MHVTPGAAPCLPPGNARLDSQHPRASPGIDKKRRQAYLQWRFRLQRLFQNCASMNPKSRDTNRPMLGATNGMSVALTPNHFAKVAAY